MEKQIKMTFWLLTSTLLLFDIVVYIGSVTPGYAQATTKEVAIFLFLVLSFVFFIASYISNVVKFRKEKSSKEYLVVLTLAIFFMALFFLPSYLNIHVERRYELLYMTLFHFFLLSAAIVVYANKIKTVWKNK